jgi:hypothetical protein
MFVLSVWEGVLLPVPAPSFTLAKEERSYGLARTLDSAGGQEYRMEYLPAKSNTGMFGGNSNWRGPIWMPVNIMLIRALLNFYAYYGETTSRSNARPIPAGS